MADELTEGDWIARNGVRVWEGEPPRRGVRPPAKCGTDGGYYRHLRITKTPTCDACRRAHAEAESDRRARREVA